MCTGGLYRRPGFPGPGFPGGVEAWDPRSGSEAFAAKFFDDVHDMVALDPPEGPGFPQLLTGLLDHHRLAEPGPETF